MPPQSVGKTCYVMLYVLTIRKHHEHVQLGQQARQAAPHSMLHTHIKTASQIHVHMMCYQYA